MFFFVLTLVFSSSLDISDCSPADPLTPSKKEIHIIWTRKITEKLWIIAKNLSDGTHQKWKSIKMKVVALIEHYKVDQFTCWAEKGKILSKTRFVLGNDGAISQ